MREEVEVVVNLAVEVVGSGCNKVGEVETM